MVDDCLAAPLNEKVLGRRHDDMTLSGSADGSCCDTDCYLCFDLTEIDMVTFGAHHTKVGNVVPDLVWEQLAAPKPEQKSASPWAFALVVALVHALGHHELGAELCLHP